MVPSETPTEGDAVTPAGSNPMRTLLTILMDLLIACAIAVTGRLFVEFFGQFSAQAWGKAVIAFTNPLVLPFGIHAIKTPYGGLFDANAAVMVAVFLVVEWVFSGIRWRT